MFLFRRTAQCQNERSTSFVTVMHVQLWKIDYSFFAALHSAKKRIYVVFTELEMYIIMVDRENVPFLHHCTVLKRESTSFSQKCT